MTYVAYTYEGLFLPHQAWLHRLQPFSGEDALSVLKRLTAKAQELHQPVSQPLSHMSCTVYCSFNNGSYIGSILECPCEGSSFECVLCHYLSCWLAGADWRRARHCWPWEKTLKSQSLVSSNFHSHISNTSLTFMLHHAHNRVFIHTHIH